MFRGKHLPKYMVLAQDDPGAGPENGRGVDLAAVDEADRSRLGDELDLAVGVLEDAVLVEDVAADQLYVLGDVGLGRPDPGQALLDVVEEALRQGGVLVQVDQVRRLLRRKEAHCLAVLLFETRE